MRVAARVTMGLGLKAGLRKVLGDAGVSSLGRVSFCSCVAAWAGWKGGGDGAAALCSTGSLITTREALEENEACSESRGHGGRAEYANKAHGKVTSDVQRVWKAREVKGFRKPPL